MPGDVTVHVHAHAVFSARRAGLDADDDTTTDADTSTHAGDDTSHVRDSSMTSSDVGKQRRRRRKKNAEVGHVCHMRDDDVCVYAPCV